MPHAHAMIPVGISNTGLVKSQRFVAADAVDTVDDQRIKNDIFSLRVQGYYVNQFPEIHTHEHTSCLRHDHDSSYSKNLGQSQLSMPHEYDLVHNSCM